jgi:flagellar basal body L-ring protein FlgH
MFIDVVIQETTQAETQAKDDSNAEEEAKRSCKPVKRKKSAHANKSPGRKDSLGQNTDNRRRLA